MVDAKYEEPTPVTRPKPSEAVTYVPPVTVTYQFCVTCRRREEKCRCLSPALETFSEVHDNGLITYYGRIPATQEEMDQARAEAAAFFSPEGRWKREVQKAVERLKEAGKLHPNAHVEEAICILQRISQIK